MPEAPQLTQLSVSTLRMAHQALAAVPATNSQQAIALASALSEIEAVLAGVNKGAQEATEAPESEEETKKTKKSKVK